ncbi:MAG: SDR family NAD(P)-dependent oxidoreductase [Anaerolineae bacterium]|nr:SDR family NAD(P)-dependent oxidoreductase [Anaerolineae bacterium]
MRVLPVPDTLEVTLPAGHSCLITDDGTQTSIRLAQALAARDWPVILLSFPPDIVPEQERSPLPPEITQVQLSSLEETQLSALVEQVGPVGSFIHLHPASESEELFPVTQRAILKSVFLLAKHLQPALTGAAASGRSSFMTVTRLDGALRLGKQSVNCDALSGGLAGLTKTLALEWPAVFCRAVDLSPIFDAEQSVEAILSELSDPNRRLREVGWSEQGRVTLVTATGQVAVDAGTACKTAPPGSESTFLVSGGAKGITAQCVIKLAERYQSNFVLVGRSTIEPEPVWAAGIEEETDLKRAAMQAVLASGEKPTPRRIQQTVKILLSSREIKSTLAAITAAGGQAEYISADVTDGPALHAALESVRERITGIIHGAGVLADKLIEEKSAADFEFVYGVKVEGLKNLLASVPVSQLEQVVLFSSVAGFYGNAGQADYAIGNEVLSKTAHLLQKRVPACRVLAINWGPWDGGMVTPQLKRILKRGGIEVIPVEAGTELLAGELAVSSNVVQIVVGSSLPTPTRTPDVELRTHHLHRRLTLEANPFLRDHVIGGHAVLPTVCAVAWMVNACEELYPGYLFFRAEKYRAFKGVVFDASLTDDYILDLEEISKECEELIFEGRIHSQTADGKPRYHYTARITLRRERPEAPRFTEFELATRQPVAGEQLYRENILFHGPAFQGVEQVLNCDAEGLTMRARSPFVSLETQGQFPVRSFNPYLTDVQLQSLLIWATDNHGYGGLPMQIQKGELYREVAFGDETYVTLQIKSNSEQRLVADVIVHDEDGYVYSRVTDAEITLSERMNELFELNVLEPD